MSQNESTPFLVTDAKNLTLIDATRENSPWCVSTSDISAVIGPIFTKLFGPNIFLGLNLFGPKKNISQVHLDQLFFGTKKFSVLTQKYF